MYERLIQNKIRFEFGNQCEQTMTIGGGEKCPPRSASVRMSTAGMGGDSDVVKHVPLSE
jgi:hypothetical protein